MVAGEISITNVVVIIRRDNTNTRYEGKTYHESPNPYPVMEGSQALFMDSPSLHL
jgi:hypothetical protein